MMWIVISPTCVAACFDPWSVVRDAIYIPSALGSGFGRQYTIHGEWWESTFLFENRSYETIFALKSGPEALAFQNM